MARPEFNFSNMDGDGEPKDFDPNAPKRMMSKPGLSILAKCKHTGCEAFDKWVCCNVGMKSFNVGRDWHDDVKCPICSNNPSDEDATPIFSACNWSFTGRLHDGKKKDHKPTDTPRTGYVAMPGGRGFMAKWTYLEITTKAL